MSWVSTKEQLPEEDTEVLVFGRVLNDPPKVIGVRRRYQANEPLNNTWESEYGYTLTQDEVTHWMPLPKDPEEEEHLNSLIPKSTPMRYFTSTRDYICFVVLGATITISISAIILVCAVSFLVWLWSPSESPKAPLVESHLEGE